MSRRLLVIGFFLLLLLPALDLLGNLDPYPPHNELRELAATPDTALLLSGKTRKIAQFRDQVNSYGNDRFGFRNLLIRGFFQFKYRWLGLSTSDKVIVGKDGWLFYTGDGEADDARGAVTFTPQQLRHWAERITARKEWLAARGIRYLLVIPPNKSSVYPEYLPAAHHPGNRANTADTLVNYLRQHTDVDVVYLKDSLLTAKDSTPELYHRTDTHWNATGAFTAYTQLSHHLATLFPTIVPLRQDDFTISAKPAPGGDLAGMLGGKEFMNEQHISFVPRTEPTVHKTESNARQRDPFTLCCADKGLPRAIVFRDSFFDGLLPFFARHFALSRYYWQPYDQELLNDALLTQYQPDIVVEERLERLLKSDVLQATTAAGKTDLRSARF